ncbi:Transcriptional regulator, GntR family domain / Aspartate aminotransferase [hydrothermal vent metagenome]|uniref:Transcriptional regulator, GntR family domain / Aspartate aminotransferase n=1 Tax=hydrothermal vent metagenome TaxID=652676 RepID=A0A3B0R901_9ZZZZ
MAPDTSHTANLRISIDRDSPLSLQEQIRRKVIDDIALGVLTAGTRMPSSRQLSGDLGVSRNTIIMAYDRLVSDGHLISKNRRGLFVRQGTFGRDLGAIQVTGSRQNVNQSVWRERLAPTVLPRLSFALPPDWDQYPYPLVDGPFDRSLFPVAEWREASRRALSVQDINAWTRNAGGADDPMLVDELRRKILPLNGISAQPDEMLLTTGVQQALSLVCDLLVHEGMTVVLENPCHPELRMLLQKKSVRIITLAVDENGMMICEETLQNADIVFVSPGRQRPTGATLSDARRAMLLQICAKANTIIVEDDCQWETSLAAPAPPALRGTPGGENVIYMATLAQPLAPAIRLGVLVGPVPVIRAARTLRRITARHPALSIQRTFAHMLALGHYAAVLRRVEDAFTSRMIALREALNYYLPTKISILPTRPGASAWITGPDTLDTRQLSKRAETYGVLIEPVQDYFSRPVPNHVFRLGISGIPEDKIRDGVAAFASAFRQTMDPAPSETRYDAAKALRGSAIKRACAGATLLCKTVYGDPCTIVLNRNGEMTGRAGFANEDRDQGKWWVDGDFWCRQWSEWSYGEVGRFRVVLSGDRIEWLHEDGHLVDWAILVRRPKKPKPRT